MKKGENFYTYKAKEWARDITSLASPILLLFVPLLVMGFSDNYLKLLLALLINEVVGSLIKIFWPQKRPDGQAYKGLMEKIDAGSFPSLHASRITIVYLTLLTIVPDPIIKVIIGLVLFAVMVSRVVLKRHYVRDIIGGAVIGGIIWWIFNSYIFAI